MQVAAQFGYLVLTVPFLLFWVILFLFNKKTRHEQLAMSLLFNLAQYLFAILR